jgi:hypothetical protein
MVPLARALVEDLVGIGEIAPAMRIAKIELDDVLARQDLGDANQIVGDLTLPSTDMLRDR